MAAKVRRGCGEVTAIRLVRRPPAMRWPTTAGGHIRELDELVTALHDKLNTVDDAERCRRIE
ncbi:MAG: hypothetical protein IPG68_16205 [Micrococcales bacterium]|nr:hypothetical protein [Micrococcales bacterium]